MEKLLDKTIEFLCQHGDVRTKEEKEIIRYGLEIFYIKVIFFTATLIIGFLMHAFFECLVFNILFAGIRSFAGGYHAATRKKCFFESIIVIISVLIVFKLIAIYIFLYKIVIVFYMFSVVIVFKYAPIDTENKKINVYELKAFRKKTIIAIIVEMIILLISFLTWKIFISTAVMLALIVTAILILMALKKV